MLSRLRSLLGRASQRAPDAEPDSGLIDRIALVSANFGGIDAVRPFPAGGDVDAFYYTEEATRAAAEPAHVASWTRMIVPDYPRHDFNARLRGRYFKHQIHRLPEVARYRWLAWADANVTIHDTVFLTEAVARLRTVPPGERVFLVPHPYRATIREEYEHITEVIAAGNDYLRIRYADEKMPEQMAFFAAQGWNLDAPLWCGTIWLLENNPILNGCWDAWWDQNLRYGMMDQLSLPVIMDAFGVRCQAAEFSLTDNPHFHWGQHVKLC